MERAWRGGFPEPFLAQDPAEAERWRRQYLEDLIREDVVEFSRIGAVAVVRAADWLAGLAA